MTKLQQTRDPICLIYVLWWSLPIVTTCITMILSSLCINQCPNEFLFPYLLLGQSCFTLIIISLICYLRHGNDHWIVNTLSILFFCLYFISFLLTSVFTFRRIKYVTPISPLQTIETNNHSSTDCISYCYPIGICFFLIQLLIIICPLPLACSILILVMKTSSIDGRQSTHV